MSSEQLPRKIDINTQRRNEARNARIIGERDYADEIEAAVAADFEKKSLEDIEIKPPSDAVRARFSREDLILKLEENDPETLEAIHKNGYTKSEALAELRSDTEF